MKPSKARKIRLGTQFARTEWIFWDGPNPRPVESLAIQRMAQGTRGITQYAYWREYEREFAKRVGSGATHWLHQPRFKKRRVRKAVERRVGNFLVREAKIFASESR